MSSNLDRSTKKIKKNYKTLTLDISFVDEQQQAQRLKKNSKTQQVQTSTKKKSAKKQKEKSGQVDANYCIFAQSNLFPKPLQDILQKNETIQLDDFKDLELTDSQEITHQQQLKEMRSLSQKQEIYIKKLMNLKDSQDLFTYFVKRTPQKKIEEEKVVVESTESPKKEPELQAQLEECANNNIDNKQNLQIQPSMEQEIKYSKQFTNSSNVPISDPLALLKDNEDIDLFLNFQPDPLYRQSSKEEEASSFNSLHKSPHQINIQYDDSNNQTSQLYHRKKFYQPSDRVEDFTDLIGFVDDKLETNDNLMQSDFFNNAQHEKSRMFPEDLFLPRKIEMESILSFENQM